VAELPTGTVTFLFTDVEGSTRLLHELGDAYVDALGKHRKALRECFARHGGVEVDTQGDAFFVAFARASDALAAAADGQAALETGPIRVRIGLHTGEPLVTEEGYVGIDVHRAARIAAVGYGGQILVSQSTRDLAAPAALRDLGDHRLKDLTAPERIYQLGEGDFPPLKSLNTTNLPVASNPLVGRETELAELTGMLTNSERLVTLTGPGGSGKTRLGLQVGAELLEDFPGGVFFVPLASLSAPELVRPAIARAAGVRQLEELAGRRALLLLDNFEHLLGAATEVAALLEAGGSAKVLATSRAPLRVHGECEFAVDPLLETDAVELLVQRARSVRRDFAPDEHAKEICRRLDGLPLAVELAAARLRSLDSAALLERLGDARGLLHEAVDLALQFGDRVGLSWYLSQFALALAHESRSEDAGRIWGAVEAAAAFIPGGPWPRDMERLRREVMAFADVAFETGRQSGRSLSLEEAATWMCALD